MFGGIGMQEILLILLIVLLVFGAKRLPELGQAMGRGIREFKRGVSDIEEELRSDPAARRRGESKEEPKRIASSDEPGEGQVKIVHDEEKERTTS